MKGHGFTLIELAVVLSISSLLVPLLWMFGRTMEADHRDALAGAIAAHEMRSLSEELRRDLRTMRWQGPGGLVLANGSCARIEYVLVGEVLERRASDACGGTRVVAAPVRRIARSGRRLEVAFSHRAGRDDERDTRFVAFLLAEETP